MRGNRRYRHCKECHKAKTKRYKAKDAETPAHELRCIQWLKSCGVPAVRGRLFPDDGYQFVDVVAFGIVRVEVKIEQQDGRIYFTDRQQSDSPYDVIIVERNEKTYHVFMPQTSLDPLGASDRRWK